jgi:hypothetical protein
MYLSPKKLYCEVIVSKAQGRLTRRAQSMLILLADRTIKKLTYYNPDDRFDCYQQGLYDLFKNWHNFNEEKSENSFAYLTEIFKRGATQGLNKIHKRKGSDGQSIKVYSIDNINDGQGMHNI